MIHKRIWIPFVVTFMIYICHPQLVNSTVSVAMKKEPHQVAIGAFFNGTYFSVSGDVGAENDVAVIVEGNQNDLTLKKKGKALGLLWMNMGDVHFKKVPNLYILYTSKKKMASGNVKSNSWDQLGIGFDFLKKEMEIEGPAAERDELAHEFLKLKQNQGLYASHPDEISFEPKNETEKSFTVNVWIPPRIPTGVYQVKVLEIHDGVIVDSSKNRLEVKEEGIPLMLSELAFNHSLLYGFLAVLIAVAAGLIMDFFFGTGKGGGAH